MAHTEHFHAPEPDDIYAPGVEPDHISLRAVFGFAVGLAVVAAIAHFAMLGMYWMMDRDHASDPRSRVFPIAVSQDLRTPPEPRLQGGVQTDNAGRLLPDNELTEHNAGPKEALRELREEEDQILTGYSWVDRNNKIVHIPIDAAMKLTLQHGLPSRPQVDNAETHSGATASAAAGQETRK